MAKLYERINSVMNFCRVFGLGFQLDSSMTALTVDALFVLVYLSFCIFGYKYVTSMMQERLPNLWDITTVMSVVKVYVYLLTAPAMIVTWQYNKQALTDLLCRLDEIVLSIDSIPLSSYVGYSVTWLSLSILVEFFAYSMLHIYQNFVYFLLFEYVMIAVYVTWSMLPVLLYVFMIDLICRGVRNVNDRIISIGTWRTYRSQWKELRYAAVYSAENEFGINIVVFIMFTITEIVYFVFWLYFIGFKGLSTNAVYNYMNSMSVLLIIMLRTSWLFQIVQVSQNCKSEMLRTRKILNSVKINTESDFKELKYVSLYMLHTDFNFMPCNIFELSYRNLLKIATIISAFVTFQIQMKLH